MFNKIKRVSRFVLALAFIFSFFVIVNPVEAKAKESISKDIIDLDVTESTTDDVDNTEDATNSNKDDTTATGSDDSIITENDKLQDITNNILPDVDAESFFAKIYNKLFAACNGIQKIVGIILIIFFILGIIMIGVSFIFTKKNVMWYVWATFVIAILFVCDLYAVQIISAIAGWFTN